MKYFELESWETNLNIAKVIMGSTMAMSALPKEDLFTIFDAYYAAGGNCIDTARFYSNGKSEELIGEWMQCRGNREHIIISTKCCHPKEEEMDKSRLSLEDMEQDYAESLVALKTDYIDLYWIHKDDEERPVEEIIDNINILIKRGKIRAIGCSNWKLNRVIAANEYAKKMNLHGFSACQIQWSLARTKQEDFDQYGARVMNDEIYNYHRSQRLPVFAFSSQAQGFFIRTAEAGIRSLPEGMRNAYASEENLLRLNKVIEMAKMKNTSISSIVVGYIINNRLPGVAIIGAENVEQLRLSLEAADLEMTYDEADALYKI